ncbi:MAG: dethiobiotin synthetase [Cellvibrionales bacterium TMED49]|nr:dethiobiotin synthetase [Porticoccaceae bacterium]OUU38504.1 MAG: dethiobiotin synthetase [Cellvibrionales bacterium TMED49]
MRDEPKLSQEDLERVQQFISTGYNTIERKPFRGFLLFLVTWSIVAVLGIVSYLIGKWVGYL